MSNYDMNTDQVIHSTTADTDCTVLILDGSAYALYEDGDDECVGYYQQIAEGQYVYAAYHGYSYYVEDGVLHSMHGEPDDLDALNVNDGNQRIAYRGDAIAKMIS